MDLPERVTLQDVVTVVRGNVLETFRQDSCIASTRVVIDVLDYFGIVARPRPVAAVAFNPEGYQLFLKGVPLEEWPKSAHSVGVKGTGPHVGDRWDGHLVAVNETHLFDASLDQMSRPEQGIPLEASVFVMPAEVTSDQVWWERADGVVVIYGWISDGAWRRSKNWSRREPAIRQAIGRSIRQLKGEL